MVVPASARAVGLREHGCEESGGKCTKCGGFDGNIYRLGEGRGRGGEQWGRGEGGGTWFNEGWRDEKLGGVVGWVGLG